MRELPDFSDSGAVEAWFKTQPHGVAIAIAARASLRVLPSVMRNIAPDANADDVLGERLAVFRANLVSAARAICPADEAQQAEQLQDAAARSIFSDPAAAYDAGHFVALAAALAAARAAAFAAAHHRAHSDAASAGDESDPETPSDD